MNADERAHLVAMSALPYIGPARLRRLAELGDPSAQWSALIARRVDRDLQLRPEESAAISTAAASFDVVEHVDRHARSGIGIDVLGEPDYPEVLAADHEAPVVLFSRGAPLGAVSPSVGIVGTRTASGYGCSFAFELGAALIDEGITVISGLALGIDAAAHSGAVSRLVEGADGTAPVTAGDAARAGSVIGVVGCGLDRTYPQRNRVLHHAVIDNGSLIAEVPIGTVPARWRFPARNRMIAALSDVLVVVESGAAGGSMITVDEATTRSRTVLAVPGPVTSDSSAGTNQLIADGCGPCRHVGDVLTALQLSPIGPWRNDRSDLDHAAELERSADVARRAQLSPAAQDVLSELDWVPTTLDRLASGTGRGFGEVCEALDQLIGAGLARERGGRYERMAGPR